MTAELAEPLVREMAERLLELRRAEQFTVARAWARYLLSDHVTGRVGLVGAAFLEGLAAPGITPT